MKKLLFLAFCLIAGSVWGQSNVDSLALVQAPWAREVITAGVVWKHVHLNQKELFGSNQYISVLEIAPNAPIHFSFAAEPVLTTTDKLAQTQNAIAAINGSFFKFPAVEQREIPNKVDYNSADYLRIDGQILAGNTYNAAGWRQRHQESAMAILDGKLYIIKATEEKNWEEYIYSQDVMCSGPLLSIDGRKEPLREESFYTTRHPRTVVAKKPDGTVLLFVVDGRHAQAEGMSLGEIQNTLLWLGACDILNLDGGGSTAMYIKDKGENGIVNHPSDNKLFDHQGTRRVANAVVVN